MGKKRIFEEEAESSPVEDVKEEEEKVEVAKPNKKAKAAKPLPAGYVCNACGARDDHPIYNCPQKLSKKGGDVKAGAPSAAANVTATAASSAVADNNESEPASYKKYVFVSGLPFDTNKGKLLDLIREKLADPSSLSLEMKDVFIVTFKDNPQKCRGLAYVTCHNAQQFNDVLTLNGHKLGRFQLSAVESTTSDASKGERKPTDNFELVNKKEKQQKGTNHNSSEPRQRRCYRCGGAHDPATCENPRICYKCRGTDHLSKDCPKKKPQAN